MIAGSSLLDPATRREATMPPSRQPTPSLCAVIVGVLTVALGADQQTALAQTTSTLSTYGTTYYVDSRTGSDANNGLAPTSAGGARPWKSLARVANAALLPGDTVLLACGAAWNETLQLRWSGIWNRPITIGAYPAGCSNRPVIDGGAVIPSTAWQLHGGSIYKAQLLSAPAQVHVDGSPMEAAHHPNRGFNAAQPNSLYLTVASDSAVTTIDGAARSNYLTSGPDLVLPVGANLAAGAAVRIRTAAWVIDEANVTAVSGSRLTLSKPTEYPLKAGWGYYLLGQLWMLDSPGEWHYDSVSKTLYVWMPDSRAPAARIVVSDLAAGVEARSRKYVVIDGIAVRRVGTGIDVRASVGVVVRNSTISDTADMGVNAGASQFAQFDANVISRTGSDAISGADNNGVPATGMRVTNNQISSSGVIMSGETPAGLPRRSFAAIRSGLRSVVSGNSVKDTGNIGIKPMADSTVSRNHVSGACSVLDDCGGIYTSGANNYSLIADNIVQGSRGSVLGKPAAKAYTQAQGIYLDESASGVTVRGNTVVDADNGIQLHKAANSVIEGNKLYGNRNNQLWLQETSNRNRVAGDVFGNRVVGNQLVSTTPSALNVHQSTIYSNTYSFAQFDLNKYFDRIFQTINSESTSSGYTRFNLQVWKSATTSTGTPRNLDPNGTGASQLKYASYRSVGGSVIPNGSLTTSLQGWTSWNQIAPYGGMSREACTPGFCAVYAAGASSGILSSPFFPVVKGQWYRVSFDLRASQDKQFQPVVVRNGGGGTAGYERVSNVALSLNGSVGWKRYSFVFQAIQSVVLNDPITGGKGARVDFERVMPGTSVSVANLELVPISSVSGTTRTDILINASAAPSQIACPAAGSSPATCNSYLKMSDNTPVTWPHYAPAMSSEIVYTLDSSLVDSDGDGVPDSQDLCRSTPTGLATNAAGCGLGE